MHCSWSYRVRKKKRAGGVVFRVESLKLGRVCVCLQPRVKVQLFRHSAWVASIQLGRSVWKSDALIFSYSITFIYLFSFNVITIFFPPIPLLLPDENAKNNNCGIYTLAESKKNNNKKKTIIINYFENKKNKCEGAPFSLGRLARLPCGCDKTNRALWVLGLMEFWTSGSSFFFPPPPFFFVSCRGRLGF